MRRIMILTSLQSVRFWYITCARSSCAPRYSMTSTSRYMWYDARLMDRTNTHQSRVHSTHTYFQLTLASERSSLTPTPLSCGTRLALSSTSAVTELNNFTNWNRNNQVFSSCRKPRYLSRLQDESVGAEHASFESEPSLRSKVDTG